MFLTSWLWRVSSISRSSIPCGLGSIIAFSSSKKHKGMIELLSLVGIAIWRCLLIYVVVCDVLDALPHTSLLEKQILIFSLEAALACLMPLFRLCLWLFCTALCPLIWMLPFAPSAVPGPPLSSKVPCSGKPWFISWCMLMTVRELQLTHAHTHKTTH